MKKPSAVPVQDQQNDAAPLRPLAVSVKTARQLLDIGNSKMWELISEGRVQTVKLGRKRLVLYNSLEALLNPSPR
jgi:excisionase family DNA binding protein